MQTYSDFKKQITSIPAIEMDVIHTLSYLEAKRIDRGISQSELAKRIGMNTSQLASIERMDHIPSLKTLSRYANGLG
ncbi:helix-turn-helix domain-containing protein [Companilactobacillus zhongbaensis]|uniref:helix-turn-helix domain-containing protein n=1 Tax=Companilactobacillus zhongbaensis TaxID=2486009 RepID=UPI000F7A5DD6|nr:helix-turn-helix transcriptional regulator [Companilactobacillus zhongbaensis]